MTTITFILDGRTVLSHKGMIHEFDTTSACVNFMRDNGIREDAIITEE